MFNWHKKESPILSLLGFGGGGSGSALSRRGGGLKATGGDQEAIQPGNGYVYHTFTTTGAATFTVTNPSLTTVEVFMVGGGGRGSTGGGGAGALMYKTGVPVSAQAYPVTIGAGGVSFPAPFSGPAGPYPAGEGGNSTAFGYTAAGGGHGGVHNQNGNAGDPGGSGGAGAPRNGGGGASGGTGSGDSGGTNGSVSPNNGWGNDGANSGAPNPGGYGGGGGGAGAVGNTNGTGGGGLTYSNFAGPLLNVPTLPGLYAAGGPKPAAEGTPGAGSFPVAQFLSGSGNGGGHNATGQPDATYNGSPGIVVIRYLE